MTSIFHTHYGDNLSRVNSRAAEPKAEAGDNSDSKKPFAKILADLEPQAVQLDTKKLDAPAPGNSQKAGAEFAVPNLSNLTMSELQEEGLPVQTALADVTFARLTKSSTGAESTCGPLEQAPSLVNTPAQTKAEQLARIPTEKKEPTKAPAAPQLLAAERAESEAANPPAAPQLLAANPTLAPFSRAGVPTPPDMLSANWAEDGELPIVPELPGLASADEFVAKYAKLKPRDGIEEIRTIIEGAGREHGIDPHLSMAIAHAESDFRIRAISQDGHRSKGLFQLLDSTGKDMMNHIGIDGPYQPFNPQQNATLGVGYLRRLHDMFSTETNLGSNMRTIPATSAEDLEKIAIAAYNAGQGNVARAQSKARALGKDPSDYSAIEPFLPASTRDYVKKVSSLRQAYAQTETDKRSV